MWPNSKCEDIQWEAVILTKALEHSKEPSVSKKFRARGTEPAFIERKFTDTIPDKGQQGARCRRAVGGEAARDVAELRRPPEGRSPRPPPRAHGRQEAGADGSAADPGRRRT